MQNILRLIVLFSAIVCFTACSEDDDHARTVSFKRAVYILSSNQAIEVEIGLSEVAEQELTVPFEVFGTAVFIIGSRVRGGSRGKFGKGGDYSRG